MRADRRSESRLIHAPKGVKRVEFSGKQFSFEILLVGTNSFQGTYDPIGDIIMQMSAIIPNLT